jgi:hypothetical protein
MALYEVAALVMALQHVRESHSTCEVVAAPLRVCCQFGGCRSTFEGETSLFRVSREF